MTENVDSLILDLHAWIGNEPRPYAVDALEVDGGDAEVAVSELALEHDQRYAFARHLNSVSVAGPVRREATPHSRGGGDAVEGD